MAQIIGGGTGTVTPTNLANSYMGLFTESSATEADVIYTVPVGGTIKNFKVFADRNPGLGQSYIVTLRLPNAANPMTSLSCTIVGGGVGGNNSGRCSDFAPLHSVTVVAGDAITVQITPQGTPGSTPLHWRATLSP